MAATANNSICSIGIAYNAGIGGIRMLDGPITDSLEAKSLSFNNQHVAVYSASWGPTDNGEQLDGPDRLALEALRDGAAIGRRGLGSIFTWASGNGGMLICGLRDGMFFNGLVVSAQLYMECFFFS